MCSGVCYDGPLEVGVREEEDESLVCVGACGGGGDGGGGGLERVVSRPAELGVREHPLRHTQLRLRGEGGVGGVGGVGLGAGLGAGLRAWVCEEPPPARE